MSQVIKVFIYSGDCDTEEDVYDKAGRILEPEFGKGTFICPFEYIGDNARVILGNKDPDKILKEASEWNEHIADAVRKSAANMEAWAKAEGCTVTELLGKIPYMSFDGRYKAVHVSGTPQPADMVLYEYYKSMRDLSDIVDYGSDWAVINEEEGIGVLLRTDVLEDIKQHPDHYAITEVVYKC